MAERSQSLGTDAIRAMEEIQYEYKKKADAKIREVMNNVVREIAQRGMAECGIYPGEGGWCKDDDQQRKEGRVNWTRNTELYAALFNTNNHSTALFLPDKGFLDSDIERTFSVYYAFRTLVSASEVRRYRECKGSDLSVHYPPKDARVQGAVLLNTETDDSTGKETTYATGHLVLPVYTARGNLEKASSKPVKVFPNILPLMKVRRPLEGSDIEVALETYDEDGCRREYWASPSVALIPSFSEQYLIGQKNITNLGAFESRRRGFYMDQPSPLFTVTRLVEALRRHVWCMYKEGNSLDDTAWDDAAERYFAENR